MNDVNLLPLNDKVTSHHFFIFVKVVNDAAPWLSWDPKITTLSYGREREQHFLFHYLCMKLVPPCRSSSKNQWMAPNLLSMSHIGCEKNTTTPWNNFEFDVLKFKSQFYVVWDLKELKASMGNIFGLLAKWYYYWYIVVKINWTWTNLSSFFPFLAMHSLLVKKEMPPH